MSNPFDDFTGDDGTPGRNAPTPSGFDPTEPNPVTDSDNNDTDNADDADPNGAASGDINSPDGDPNGGSSNNNDNSTNSNSTNITTDTDLTGTDPSGADPSQSDPAANHPLSAAAVGAGANPSNPLMAIFDGMAGDDDDDNGVSDMLINYNVKFADATPAQFRDEVIDQTLSVLISRTKPNPLLIGAAGVGKTAIVEEIARRIGSGCNSIPEKLRDSVIYELPVSAITADTGLAGSMEKRMQDIIAFATKPENHAIIFMDEIHQLLDQRSSMVSKAAQMLKPAMARGDIRIIGATTLQESKAISKDPAFSRRMTTIGVDELTVEQTREILHQAARAEIKHFNNAIAIPDETLDACIAHADAYLATANNRPDNAITLLSRAAADLYLLSAPIRQAGANIAVPMSAQHVANVARALASGHAQPAHFDEAELRHQLERVRGQEHVTEEIPNILKRRALRLTKRQRPLVMMFAGPSGVGKTEIANIIARHITNADPIRINGGEYSSGFTSSALLGSPKGYVGSEDNDEMPFDKLRTNPEQVILIDEVDKMHKDVWQLFLSAFDAGTLKMADHTEIDFSQAIVILTTNAGKKLFTSTPMGFAIHNESENLNSDKAHDRALLTGALTQPKGPFTTEFIGRMQFIAGFNPITKPTYAKIVAEAYERFRADIIELHPHYEYILDKALDDATIDDIVTRTYHVDHGARPARQAVTTYIEDTVLEAMAASRTSKSTNSTTAANGDTTTDNAATNANADVEVHTVVDYAPNTDTSNRKEG